MTTMTDNDGVLTQSAVEHKADCENLEALQAKRRQLVREIAPLAAKFKGSATGADSQRKRHRAGIMALIQTEQFPDAAKAPSETLLERMANADQRHKKFCEDLERDFVEYFTKENEIEELTERIRNREELLRVYRAELGLER